METTAAPLPPNPDPCLNVEITPELVAQHGLLPEEYERILGILGRTPNLTELGIFSVMWSEHCAYKNTRKLLKLFPTEKKDKDAIGQVLVKAGDENAGVIDVGEGWGVAFKIESHNHPSAIEPFEGAATGVGGIVRDIFTMGARPVLLTNSLRFGSLESSQVKRLFRGVVSGISHYGNCLGIPNMGGDVYFDDCYEGNPLVNALCAGILRHEEIQKGAATGVGNPVYYVGPGTGRDGLGGASFASRELTEESAEDRPAVQKGDPFMEKLLLEACLEIGCTPSPADEFLTLWIFRIQPGKRLFRGVVSGISHYGNCLGIPNMGGDVYFDDCYEGNPLVNALCAGILRHEEIQKGAATGVGNPVYYVGPGTGRDGLGGASFASRELTEESAEDRPAVQKGDPFMEKLLLEACLEMMSIPGLVVGIQDMGAAGLTCSTCETASRGDSGIEIDLDLVPQRETGMNSYEIMLSESQERMLVIVAKGRERELEEVFEKWDLHAAHIGEVKEGNRMVVRQKGVVVADLPAKSLTDEAPIYDQPATEPAHLAMAREWKVDSIPELGQERGRGCPAWLTYASNHCFQAMDLETVRSYGYVRMYRGTRQRCRSGKT